MHLLLTPDWNTEGETLAACELPQHVIAVNCHEGADRDEDYINNVLSEALSDAFGFCHEGFDVAPVVFGHGRYNLPGRPQLSEEYTVSIMLAPPKSD